MNNTQEWYDYIDDLVIRFQAGETECGEELIKIFQPFFLKYITIVKDGKINLADRDTRRFLSLFMNEKEHISKVRKKHMSSETRNAAYKTAFYLSKSCETLTEEELMQELYLAFFILIGRWVKKKGKSNFCGYLYNSFRYEARRSISDLIKDPIVNNLNLRYYDDENEQSEVDVLDKFSMENTIMLSLEEEIDSNWVRGLTCSEEFLELTTLQRMILKEYYMERMPDRVIAEKTGLHINTIFRNRTKAVGILGNVYI